MRLLLITLLLAAVVEGAEQKVTVQDGLSRDQLGFAVAIHGDTAVLGSLRDAAYVLVRSNGVWGEQAKLTARDGVARDEFGSAVVVDDDTIAIGARKRDAVAIFERNGLAWTETATLTGAEAGVLFGHAVALDGDTIAIGAPLVDVPPFGSFGAVYVFVRAGDACTRQARIPAPDGFTADNFGLAVALEGNTLVVGNPTHDLGGSTNQGAVYVFVRQGNIWTQQAKLIAADGAAFDELGRSVAISGDTILAGAVGPNAYQGAAYAFVRTGNVWTQQARLAAPGGAANDRFGFAVGLSGDTAVIGSFAADIGAHANQGTVSLFARRQGVWTHQAQLTAADGTTFDNLGYAIAISGNDILAGAPGDDAFTNEDQGAAYLFRPAARRRAVRR